jgi:hypothetical protein
MQTKFLLVNMSSLAASVQPVYSQEPAVAPKPSPVVVPKPAVVVEKDCEENSIPVVKNPEPKPSTKPVAEQKPVTVAAEKKPVVEQKPVTEVPKSSIPPSSTQKYDSKPPVPSNVQPVGYETNEASLPLYGASATQPPSILSSAQSFGFSLFSIALIAFGL